MSDDKLAEAIEHTRRLAPECEQCLTVCDAAARQASQDALEVTGKQLGEFIQSLQRRCAEAERERDAAQQTLRDLKRLLRAGCRLYTAVAAAVKELEATDAE